MIRNYLDTICFTAALFRECEVVIVSAIDRCYIALCVRLPYYRKSELISNFVFK